MSVAVAPARRTEPKGNHRFAFDIVLATAILVGFALRIYRLDGQSLWEEEIFSLEFYARKSIAEIIRFNITAGDPQPPLYYIFLHLWTLAAGFQAFALRFLSLVASVLSIPATYQFGKRLFRRRTGLVAAIIVALNPFQIWYAQEARTYSLTLLLTLLSSVLLLRAIGAGRRKFLLVAYVLVTSLAIYSHYYAYFVVLAHGLSLLVLWLWRSRQLVLNDSSQIKAGPILPFWIALAAVFIPYLPWIPYAAKVIGAFTGWYTPVSSADMVAIVFSALVTGPTIAGLAQSIFNWLFVALILAGLFGQTMRLLRRSKGLSLPAGWPTLFGLSCLVLPLVGTIIFVQYTNRIVFHERYFIIIAPALATFLALGTEACSGLVERLSHRPGSNIVALSVFLVAFIPILGASAVNLYDLYTVPGFQKADIRSALAYIKAVKQEGDVVLTTNPGLAGVINYYDEGAVPIEWIETRTEERRQQAISRLSEIAGQAKRIWYIPYWEGGIEQQIEGWLDQNAYRASHTWFTKARVIEYAVAQDKTALEVDTRRIQFANLLETTGIAIASEPVSAGGIIPINLTWKANGAGKSDARVLLDLEDQRGNHYSRVERTLPDQIPGGDLVQNYGLSVPIGTPPGRYDILMLLLQQGRNVEALDAAGLETGQIKVKLGEVSVAKGPRAPEAAVSVTTRNPIDFGDLAFLGHDLSDVEVTPGEPLAFSLYWQPRKDLTTRLLPRITVKDAAGQVLGEAKGSLAEDLYPTDRWTVGEIVRDIRQLTISALANTGVYSVTLSVEGPDGKLVGQETTIARLRVTGRNHNYDLPANVSPLGIRFGSFALLEGYDISFQQDPTARALITLYWKASGPSDAYYKVFVHALDANQQIIGQDDDAPAGAKAPTPSWLENEVIVDSHTIEVTRGETVAFFRIGLYDEKTGTRLIATRPGQASADDSFLLPLGPGVMPGQISRTRFR